MGAQEQGADLNRWRVIPRTLIFIRNGDDVLLMKRSLHKRVFPGRYNGIGGHIERDEEPYTSALREITEETGLPSTALRNVQLRGIDHIDTGDSGGIMLFIFTAWAQTREVRGGDEGMLHWVPLSEVTSLPLVEDVEILLKRIFATDRVESEPPFFAHVHYNHHGEMIMRFASFLHEDSAET